MCERLVEHRKYFSRIAKRAAFREYTGRGVANKKTVSLTPPIRCFMFIETGPNRASVMIDHTYRPWESTPILLDAVWEEQVSIKM